MRIVKVKFPPKPVGRPPSTKTCDTSQAHLGWKIMYVLAKEQPRIFSWILNKTEHNFANGLPIDGWIARVPKKYREKRN